MPRRQQWDRGFRVTAVNITIICIGNLKEAYLHSAQELLLGRILKKNQVNGCTILELREEAAPENASAAQGEQILQAEGQRILDRIPPKSRVISLDIDGRKATPEFFGELAGSLRDRGETDLVFIIGGSLGISPEVKARSHSRVSFSRLTYPHQVFRIALLDAIARYL